MTLQTKIAIIGILSNSEDSSHKRGHCKYDDKSRVHSLSLHPTGSNRVIGEESVTSES